jgi:hypothetical protein
MRYIKLEHSIRRAEWIDGQWHITVERADGSTFVDVCDMFLNGGGVLKYVLCTKHTRGFTNSVIAIGNTLISKVFILSRALSCIAQLGIRI